MAASAANKTRKQSLFRVLKIEWENCTSINGLMDLLRYKYSSFTYSSNKSNCRLTRQRDAYNVVDFTPAVRPVGKAYPHWIYKLVFETNTSMDAAVAAVLVLY